MPEQAFRIDGSRTVGRFGFLRIEELTVGTPSGTVARTAVRHPGAVAILALQGEGVILIRQYRAPVDLHLLELPAGKLDVDGEPPEETAVRELAEETGFRPGSIEHVGDFYTTPGFSDEHMSLFVATDLAPVATAPHGPEEEYLEVVTVPVADVPSLLDGGAVEDAKTIVGLQWLLLHPR